MALRLPPDLTSSQEDIQAICLPPHYLNLYSGGNALHIFDVLQSLLHSRIYSDVSFVYVIHETRKHSQIYYLGAIDTRAS